MRKPTSIVQPAVRGFTQASASLAASFTPAAFRTALPGLPSVNYPPWTDRMRRMTRPCRCRWLPASCAPSLDLASLRFPSLDRPQDDYAMSASLAVSITRAALGLAPGQTSAPISALKGVVINVNIPIGQASARQCVCVCVSFLFRFGGQRGLSPGATPHLTLKGVVST